MLLRFKADFCMPPEFEREALNLLEQAEDLMGKAVKVQLDQDPIEHTGEKSFLELHKCYHGEKVNKPCEKIKRIEV